MTALLSKSWVAAALSLASLALALGSSYADEPRLFLQPASAPAGSTITASGTGFCAGPDCSAVTITVDGSIAARDIAVGEDGTFSVRLSPLAGPGQYAVVATQETPSGQLSAGETLILTVSDRPSPVPTTPIESTATITPTPTTDTPSPEPSPTPTRSGPAPTRTALPTPVASADDNEGGVPWYAWVVGGALAIGLLSAGVILVVRRFRGT